MSDMASAKWLEERNKKLSEGEPLTSFISGPRMVDAYINTQRLEVIDGALTGICESIGRLSAKVTELERKLAALEAEGGK